MRIIIPCAGKAARWGGNVNKHLVKLCGEPILHRAVRLLDGHEVLIVAENHLDPNYRVDGSSRRKARLGTAAGDIDKIASSLHLWDGDGDTLILFGDVWWSLPAIETVLAADVDDWTAFGRFGPGGVGGEIFGFRFTADMRGRVAAAIRQIEAAGTESAGRKGGLLRGGWALYRTLCGAPLDEHADHGRFVTIDDWTEDMDGRRDWDNWCWRWAQADDDERREQVG